MCSNQTSNSVFFSARHDDFLDPRSGFWGDDMKDIPFGQPPSSQQPHQPPFFHGPSFFWSGGSHYDMEKDINDHIGGMFRDFEEMFGRMGIFEMPNGMFIFSASRGLTIINQMNFCETNHWL